MPEPEVKVSVSLPVPWLKVPESIRNSPVTVVSGETAVVNRSGIVEPQAPGAAQTV